MAVHFEPRLGELEDSRFAFVNPIEKIGDGGYGDVFRGTYITVGGAELPAALKVVEVARCPQVVNEVMLLLNVPAHKNVVQLYGYSYRQGTGKVVLVMELLPGGDLLKVQQARFPVFLELPMEQRLDLVIGAAEGLAHLHAMGVIHGDIKPANVVRDADGNAKLVDLGLAAAASRALENVFYGTLNYAAPELYPGSSFPGGRSKKADVWAFGVLLYAIFTGRDPLNEIMLAAYITSKAQQCPAFYMREIAVRLRNGERPRLDLDLAATRSGSAPAPDGFVKLVGDCWALDPAARPDMKDVTRRLKRMAQARAMSRNPDTAKVTPLDAVSMSEKKRCTWKRCCILWCCFACALAIFVAITVRSVSQLGMSGAQCSYCKPHIVMPGSTRIALNGQSASFRSVLSNNSNASYVVPLSSDCAAVVIQESRYPNLCMLTLQLHVVYGDPSVFAHVGGRTTASADNSNAFAVFSQPARLRYLSMSKNSVVLTEDMKLSCISDLNAFGECLFFVTVESSQSKSADVAVTVMVVPYWTASESPSPTVSDTASISHSQSRTTSPTRSSGTSKAPKQCFAFAYTGSYQFFTVPVDATSLMVTLWGGGGGVGDQNTAHGGAGAYLTGTLTGVNGGDRLRLIIGCGGCMGGQDARGGGGTSLWSWTDASLAQGGGRTAVQLCRQKPCGNLNVSSTTGWLDHVTAGGGGAGNGYNGGYATWMGPSTRGYDCAVSTTPTQSCSGGGASQTQPGSAYKPEGYGLFLRGGDGFTGGGGGYWGGAGGISSTSLSVCCHCGGLWGAGAGSSFVDNLVDFTGEDPVSCTNGHFPGGARSQYYSAGIAVGATRGQIAGHGKAVLCVDF